MNKIEKMVKAYNKKAEKWGYDKIEIVNGSINKPFKIKYNCMESMNVFKKMKMMYRDGNLMEDYYKILAIL